MKLHLAWILTAFALTLSGCNHADPVLATARAQEPKTQKAEPTKAKQEKPMGAPIVFFDIAAPDMKKQKDFYTNVFKWDIAADGRFSVSVVSPLPGLLRADPKDKLLYMGVPDVTAALKEIEANGGKIDAPRFAVPGVVVLGLFTDPAGNRMGLVEMDGDKPRIP